MRTFAKLRFLIFFNVFFILLTFSYAQNSVTLRRTFIDSLKNSISFYGDYVVDKAHKKANTAKNDGDMHIAGRNKQIGLPVVAEIMNAKDYLEATELVHNIEGTDESIKMQGVWRLWFEHPHGDQIQTDIPEKFNTTNPDHIFELHPILKINDFDLVSGLRPVKGFTPKTASVAFNAYLKTKCIISCDKNHIKIESKKIGYNYVKFKLEITGQIRTVSDGSIVNADVYTMNNKKIAENIRMIFVKNSEPEKELKQLNEGDKMQVLGIPRVNLSEISKMVENNTNANADEINGNLPFEMIIVAVY
jgi:hypothetical protein